MPNTRPGVTPEATEKQPLWKHLEDGHYNILGSDSPIRLTRSGAHATLDLYISNMANISKPIIHLQLSSDHYPSIWLVGTNGPGVTIAE